MAPTILYTACLLGAVAIYLLMRPAPRPVKLLGIVIGLGALAWLFEQAAIAFVPEGEGRPEAFFAIFSLIAVASAVRMITHTRPVYCALYFVLVVLSAAGLFLLLSAEFMAFALVIVYAGAILITYLFVLMLAQQAPQQGDVAGQAEYDVVPREPAAAAVVGFVILALLSDVILEGSAAFPEPPSVEQAQAQAWQELDGMPGRRDAVVERLAPGASIQADDQGRAVHLRDGRAFVDVLERDANQLTVLELPADAMPENVQRVGWALVAKFPVSLELAGVILLMALFGAVVLARRQIELGEDEKREAAGLRRLGLESESPPDAGGGAK
jgi:NADH-quinone oxidoreductase subunit J